MDGLKSDSETELTSTMGNALSVTNKDEKNDTNDATPTSSTDASTASTSSRIVSDDPISSTSSDTVEQTKASEMRQSVTDLLEMNIPSEKITEDVEDLVHDLESLLGESTDSFSIPSRTPPEEQKEAEDVVSQTSGELNEEQEDQIPVTCDAENHSEESAKTLEDKSTSDASAKEEKLDLGASTSKVETDITSSESCLEIAGRGDDANEVVTKDLHQTTSNTDSPLDQEIQPAHCIQEEKQVIDADGGASSQIVDDVEEPQVGNVSDSGDVGEVEDITTKQEVTDRSEEHVTDTGDHVASEPKSDTYQEAECEKDISSQTGNEKNDRLEENESPRDVEGNTDALDEGAADRDIIITSDLDRPDGSNQESKTYILEETTTEGPADSNIANSEDLKDEVDETNTPQNIQERTEESEAPADPSGSCLAVELQQSVEDAQHDIEDTDKKVIGSPEAVSETQPELQKDSEELENESVIDTMEPTESEQNKTVSQIPEISEDTVSGSNELSETKETAVSTEDNVLIADEASSDINQTSPQEMSGDIESVASLPTEHTENDDPVEATSSVKNDDVYKGDAEDMSEIIPTHPEISETVDTSNSEAISPTEVEGDNSECATPSSSSEVTAISHHEVAKDNLQSEEIGNAPIADVEGYPIESIETACENVRDTQEEDETKSYHLKEIDNQPSVSEPELDRMEVPNVESPEAVDSEQNVLDNTGSYDMKECAEEPRMEGPTAESPEAVDCEQDVPDNTGSYDMKDCAEEPLEGVSTDPADKEEAVKERETDRVRVEENETAIGDEGNDKFLEKPDDSALSPTHSIAEYAIASDPISSDIPMDETIDSHQTVDNVVQIEDKCDIPAEEKEGKDLKVEEQNTEKIEEQSNVLENKEDMNVQEETVDCQVISDATDPSVTDKLSEEMKLKTDDVSLDESSIQEVECSQSYESVMEKPNSNIQQLAESSGILEELDNDSRVEHTSNKDSIPLQTEMDATSTIDGNEIGETNDSEGAEKSELSPIEAIESSAEEMLNECTKEILTQPDSTQSIEKNIDDDEKSSVDSPEAIENDEEVKASETSEASSDNQNMGDIQVATETVSDDDSSPAESDKPSEVLIDSSEDNSNVAESESKPPKITQLEFAPLVLSEEDSEEEAVPTLRLDNDREVEGNIEDSQQLPQLDDIIAHQPVIVESSEPVDNADMQENLETILAVASLQKIDIPRETESEQVFSETERREMEALRRAVESITDNSASAYVEEAEEVVNIPLVESAACDANASSVQTELIEALPMEESVNQVETEPVEQVEETVTMQEVNEIDNIVQDETSYHTDVEKQEETTETKVPDSSEPTTETVEFSQEQDDMVNQEDTNIKEDTVEHKSQELETHVDEVASSGQNDKVEIDLETKADSSVVSHEAAGNSEQDISTFDRAEVAVAPEVNVCQTADPNTQSTYEKIEVPVMETEEISSGPSADDTNVQNVLPEEDKLETNENSEGPIEVIPEGDKNEATVTVSGAGESPGVEAAMDEPQQEVIEIIPEPTKSDEQKDSQQMNENCSTKGDLTVESHESEASEKLDEGDTTETNPETTQEREHYQKLKKGENESQERETAQVVVEQNTETKTEIGELQQREVLQKVNEQESTEPVSEPSESQERVAVRNVNQQENLETYTEEREATQEVDEEESTETDAELVESQESEATEKVNDEDRGTVREAVVGESTETEPEVGGSQEREATQKVDQRRVPHRRTGLRNTLPEQETLIDSSQVTVENEAQPAPAKEKEVKVKTSDRPKRHKKFDNKLEELSINVDVPDREKPYSPKITIKPIKVPDEEVSTTSNSEAEVSKGCLKMTITKQSDKLHSVLKVCDSENPESTTDVEEPIPKLKIKPKMQQLEQQHSPKMSTRSSNQRSLSPRITIKPVVKPDKQEALSPLKIKIGLKSEETPKKHTSKGNARSKQEDDTPRKVLIKPVVKPAEEGESALSPRITIKLPKPEDAIPPRVNIKAIRKQDEENDEKERSSPKITIKPVVKPHDPDSHPEEGGEEVKERIVLKINKGNLPTPTKESKKREHPPDDEKSEKLAKITVKFSKEGGHPHIVQQMEESSHKRSHDEPGVPEKNKKQKVEAESTMSTRSRHKEVLHDPQVETKSRHKEHGEGSDSKSKLKDTDTPQFESSRSSKHKDHSQQESPIEPKRAKLKDPLGDFPGRQSRRSSSRSRQREAEAVTAADDVQIVEPKLNSPIVISEDSRSQDSASVILVEDSREELSTMMNLTPRSVGSDSSRGGTPRSDSVATTPSTTPTPRKRGRPRKVPIEVREEFKDQDELPVKTKPKQQQQQQPQQPQQQEEEGEASSALQLQQQQQSAPSSSAQESGRPKRSCRGPSVCDRLGIKPRQPRGGPGRGRGGKRGVGTRPTPMKPEKSSK